MCFSATASLVAGGALVAAGGVTLRRATRRERALAAIPLLFGVQQLLDGAVWLSFGAPYHALAVYGYALFAFVWWPLFVPLVLASIEPSRVRREAIEALALVGIGVALFFLSSLVSGGVSAAVVNRCIAYAVPHPYPFGSLAFYLIATAGPFFLSSGRLMRLFGVVLLGSFAIAGWFYAATFSSTWCFFSAILSGIIYGHFSGARRRV
jgi:hypothetical protein